VSESARFFGPNYAATSPILSWMQTKDGKRQLVAFNTTGSITAPPIEDYLIGQYMTRNMNNLDDKSFGKFYQMLVGDGSTITIDAFSRLIKGEPVGAKYDEGGLYEYVTKGLPVQARKFAGAPVTEEQHKVANQYGEDAVNRGLEFLFEFGGAPAKSTLQMLRGEQRAERLKERMSEYKDGKLVPKGYGPKPGMETPKQTRTDLDIALQSNLIPYNVRLYELGDMEVNMAYNARDRYMITQDRSDETLKARRVMNDEEKREEQKAELDFWMKPWVEESATMLKAFGIEDAKQLRNKQADLLAKSGLSDWEIEYLLGIRKAKYSFGSGGLGGSLGGSLGGRLGGGL